MNQKYTLAWAERGPGTGLDATQRRQICVHTQSLVLIPKKNSPYIVTILNELSRGKKMYNKNVVPVKGRGAFTLWMIPGAYFFCRLSRPYEDSATGGIRSI
jgi:hypothetical protein